MADVKLLAPKILKWEGGYVNDPDDRGGATNMGITLNTWKAIGYPKNGTGKIQDTDIQKLSVEDFKFVLKKYWDKCGGDEIANQGVAEIWVDWLWASGQYAIRKVQQLVGVRADGIVGPATVAAVNSVYPHQLFASIADSRLEFVEAIVKRDPTQAKFLKGWQNRINSYIFY